MHPAGSRVLLCTGLWIQPHDVIPECGSLPRGETLRVPASCAVIPGLEIHKKPVIPECFSRESMSFHFLLDPCQKHSVVTVEGRPLTDTFRDDDEKERCYSSENI